MGCLLACASSDGNVSVLEFEDNRWEHKIFPAHGIGVNAVSWAPALYPGAIFSRGQHSSVRRFVTGGSDNLVKIWDWKYVVSRQPHIFRSAQRTTNTCGPSSTEHSPEMKSYNCSVTLTGHTDWVRDVAWAPTILQKSYVASASQDKTVRIWTCNVSSSSTNHDPSRSSGSGAEGEDEGASGGGGGPKEKWQSTVLNFDTVLWRVSWSLSGNVLAVSGGDNKVSLWKENLRGEWECVKTIEE